MTRPALPVKRGTAFPLAVRTAATYTSSEIVNRLGYGRLVVRLFADTESGTSTIDLKIQAYDEVSALWYDVAGASLAQVSANMTVPIDLVIGPGITAVNNRAVSQVVPQRCRVSMTIGGTSFRTSVEYELHPA